VITPSSQRALGGSRHKDALGFAPLMKGISRGWSGRDVGSFRAHGSASLELSPHRTRLAVIHDAAFPIDWFCREIWFSLTRGRKNFRRSTMQTGSFLIDNYTRRELLAGSRTSVTIEV
jgi:hypothetical protein